MGGLTRHAAVATLLGAALLGGAADPARADYDNPLMFRGGTWVCQSTDDYDHAVADLRRTADLKAVRAQYQAVCVYVEDEDQEDILPPFVQVLEQQGEKTLVTFFLQTEQRLAFLHRKVQQIKYTGWTAANRIQPRSEWLKPSG